MMMHFRPIRGNVTYIPHKNLIYLHFMMFCDSKLDSVIHVFLYLVTNNQKGRSVGVHFSI